jgi:hypothetical protein
LKKLESLFNFDSKRWNAKKHSASSVSRISDFVR